MPSNTSSNSRSIKNATKTQPGQHLYIKDPHEPVCSEKRKGESALSGLQDLEEGSINRDAAVLRRVAQYYYIVE
jgi:hypothetical protein